MSESRIVANPVQVRCSHCGESWVCRDLAWLERQHQRHVCHPAPCADCTSEQPCARVRELIGG